MKKIKLLVMMATIFICLTWPVSVIFADASYQINVSSNIDYAVFTLTYSGSVSGLQVTAPDGTVYNQGNCGSAYKAADGKIQIGVRYAQSGRWKIYVTGSPDDGFQIVLSGDSSYGNFAGGSSAVTSAPTPTPAPTAIPTPTPEPTKVLEPTQAPVPTIMPTRAPASTIATTAAAIQSQSPTVTQAVTPSESISEPSVSASSSATPTSSLTPTIILSPVLTLSPTPSILAETEMEHETHDSGSDNTLDMSWLLNSQTLTGLAFLFLLVAVAVLLYLRRKYILLRFRHLFAVRKIARETKRKYREELTKKSLEKRQEQLKAREELIRAQMERIEQDKIERKKQQEADNAMRQATLLSHEKEQEKKEQEKFARRIEQAKDREAARLSVKAKQIEEKSAKQVARVAKKMEALKKAPVAKSSPGRMNKIPFFLPFLKHKKQPRESRFFLFQPPNDLSNFNEYICNYSEPLHWSWNEDLVLHKIKNDTNQRLSVGDVIVLRRDEDISAYCVVPTGGLIACPEFSTHRIAQLLDTGDPTHGFNR